MAPIPLSKTFNAFFNSEKAGGLLLVVCTLVSIAIANSPAGTEHLRFWQTAIAGRSVEHWLNDALMAIFVLLIRLALERKLYVGELSNVRDALLPIFAAVGGMVVPALIHYSLNAGTPASGCADSVGPLFAADATLTRIRLASPRRFEPRLPP
jgi:Na+:H+ antiporter, NhaA family